MFRKHVSVLVLTCLISIGCGCRSAMVSGGPVDPETLTDGIYEGAYSHGPNSAHVRVTILNGKITAVELLEHDAWKGHKADDVIPGRIVENQSTAVDAVSGATNSSHVIMNAVEDAVQKAPRKEGS
ncbi:FMN-binding protein [bacterium]|nr:FMN-binding protein [bacterium]